MSTEDGTLLERLSGRVGTPQLARWILEEALSISTSAQVEPNAFEMADRYLSGEPLQYVFGHWSFRGLELKCDSRALIPRPETELLVDLVEVEIRRNPWIRRILEIGTGTGAIALSLAQEIGGVEIVATEVSEQALELSRENLALCRELKSDVVLVHSDLFGSLATYGQFDLIVSNPPYIPTTATLDSRVVDFEPHQALFGGSDGLAVISALIAQSPANMSGPGSQVLLEIDESHGDEVSRMSRRHGFEKVIIHRDLAGRNRFAQLFY